MVASVAVGYRLGQPHTVVQRIDMWLSPWDNDVRGGDQLAHALWAFATGGPTGSGPGWGDPAMIPAGNTDLVLPAIGEEWGFAGVAAVFVLVRVSGLRADLRAAARCRHHLRLFPGDRACHSDRLRDAADHRRRAGALPLSGVVSPFLSSGNTAMLANFLVFALLAVDQRPTAQVDAACRRPLRRPVPLEVGAGRARPGAARASPRATRCCDDRDYLARDAHAFEEDGVKRAAAQSAHEFARARDSARQHLTTATACRSPPATGRNWSATAPSTRRSASRWNRPLSRFDSRHYPFGAATAHLIGDLRTGENFHATNASLVEHDSNRQLQGYEYAELAPLVRYRHQPGNAGVARILARDRNVQLTVDIRLQMRAAEILRTASAAGGQYATARWW